MSQLTSLQQLPKETVKNLVMGASVLFALGAQAKSEDVMTFPIVVFLTAGACASAKPPKADAPERAEAAIV